MRTASANVRVLHIYSAIRVVAILAMLFCNLRPSCMAFGKLESADLPPLPDDHGFGGPAVGVHRDALIVAGGANFPDLPPWEGGKKVWHDRIFVLTRDADGKMANAWLEAGRLAQPFAYGASVNTDDGVLILGGESSREPGLAVPTSDVFRLTWNPAAKQVEVERLQPLPRPAAFLGAARIGSKVFAVAAERSEVSDRLDRKYVWSLDLAMPEPDSKIAWQVLTPHPGSPRHKAIVVEQALGTAEHQLFLISGENPRFARDGTLDLGNFDYLTDAYRFDPQNNTWSSIADLPVVIDNRDIPNKLQFAHERWPVAAGTGVGAGDNQLLVFSGVTGRYIEEPVGRRPCVPNVILAYNTVTDTWTQLGEMPVGVVTTSAAKWGEWIVVPSGETQPGVCTNRVQAFRPNGL